MTFKTKAMHRIHQLKGQYIDEPRRLKAIEEHAYREHYTKLAKAKAYRQGLARARARVSGKKSTSPIAGMFTGSAFVDSKKHKSIWE